MQKKEALSARKIKCIECGVHLGTIEKAKLRPGIVFYCSTCGHRTRIAMMEKRQPGVNSEPFDFIDLLTKAGETKR